MTTSLKDAICESLAATQSADKQTRELAEQQLAMLETNEDYSLHLMEVALSENIDFAIRHVASVLLSRYIGKHWSDQAGDHFQPPEVTPSVKQVLRQYLLKSLTIASVLNDGGNGTSAGMNAEPDQPTKRLLSSFAHSLSKIATYDCASSWNELFPILIGYLNSNNSSALYSSLQVFKEISHEIIDTQIPMVAPLLLPAMLNIFCNVNGQYGLRTRSTAIKIFVTISETIMMMNDLQKNATKQYLSPHLPQFAEAVIQTLSLPHQPPCGSSGGTSGGGGSDNNPLVDLGLKTDIINGLTKFLRTCRKFMKPYMPKILELIWRELTGSASDYVKYVVNSSSNEIDGDNVPGGGGGGGDDSYVIDFNVGFDTYIYSIIEFVCTIFETAKFRDLIKPVLSDLLYYVMYFIQITDEQVEMWQSDLDKFVEDDDIDSIGYSVRIAAQDLIMSLSRDMTTVDGDMPKKDDELFKIAFLHALKRHFSTASAMQKADESSGGGGGNSNGCWWKMVESCLYSLGMIAPTILYTIEKQRDTPLANEYKAILDTILSNTAHFAQPFLAGRSLWTTSRFSQIMNDQSLGQFLEHTATLLAMSDQPILRIYALRATYYFCDNLNMNRKVHVMKPYLTQFLQGLVSIGIQSKSDILFWVVQTIVILLRLDSEFTVSVASSICSLVTSAFIQYPDDPSLFDVIQELYEELFKLEQCARAMQDRVLPTIVSILAAPSNAQQATVLIVKDIDGKAVPQPQQTHVKANLITLQPLAIDILANLVRHSPLPLSDVLIQQVFPALIRCLQQASKEDTAILQNGSECLRHFVSKGSDQLLTFEVPDLGGQNGIMLVLSICNLLLSPQIPESCSSYIGRLIITLILKVNHAIGHEAIQHLLRSTLVKLNTSKDLLLTQSLILVFAHLLYTDLPTILLFLNSLPAPDGTKSALEFVLDRWLAIQLYFSRYENKAATVALCRLFRHSLLSLDPAAQAAAAAASGATGGGITGGGPVGDLASINLHHIEVHCEDEAQISGYSDTGNNQVYEIETGAMRTRSRTAAADQVKRKRKVPATVKILKLLLNEYNHLQELKEAKNAKFDSDDYATDDDDDSDDAENSVASSNVDDVGKVELYGQEVIDLTDLLLEDADEDENGDPDDVLSEEIAALDLEEVLRQVLHEFKHIPVATEFAAHLTNGECTLLNSI